MTYNVLNVRTPQDPEDLLYPTVINNGNGVRLLSVDGKEVKKFHSWTVTLTQVDSKTGQHQTLGYFGGRESVETLLVTDTRLIFADPEFHRGNPGLLTWDMPNFYLASKVIARVRTHNRALVGHVPLPSISRIVVQLPSRKHKEASLVRIYFGEATSPDNRVRLLCMTLRMRGTTDPRPLARSILNRAAQQWLKTWFAEFGYELTDKKRVVLQTISSPNLFDLGIWDFHMPQRIAVTETLLRRLGFGTRSVSAAEVSPPSSIPLVTGEMVGTEGEDVDNPIGDSVEVACRMNGCGAPASKYLAIENLGLRTNYGLCSTHRPDVRVGACVRVVDDGSIAVAEAGDQGVRSLVLHIGSIGEIRSALNNKQSPLSSTTLETNQGAGTKGEDVNNTRGDSVEEACRMNGCGAPASKYLAIEYLGLRTNYGLCSTHRPDVRVGACVRVVDDGSIAVAEAGDQGVRSLVLHIGSIEEIGNA